MAKAQPIATMPHLLIKFIIRTNFHLSTKPNDKAETEEQTIKKYICQVQKRCRLEPLVISK